MPNDHNVDESALQRTSSLALRLAEGFVIDSPDMAQIAADERNKIKAKAKALEEDRMKLTRPLDESKAAIIAKYRPHIEGLNEAVRILDTAIIGWSAEQERVRKLEQQRLEDEARTAREAAEREAAARQAEADAAAKAGAAVEQVEQLQQAAATAAVVAQTVIAPAALRTDKPAGVSVAGSLDFEEENKGMFVRYALDKGLLNLIVIDSVATRNYVRALGERAVVPGLKIVRKGSVRSTRRAA